MRRALISFVILAVAFIAIMGMAFFTPGCSAKSGAGNSIGPISPTYTVVIDESFSMEEQSSIALGADAWAAAIGSDLTFGYVTATRADIDATLERAPRPATVYFIRVGYAAEIPSCLLQASVIGCYLSQRVWIAANDVAAQSAWTKVPMHEVGHMLGLPHTDQNSVMRPLISDMAWSPTADDVAVYCQYRGCPHHVNR